MTDDRQQPLKFRSPGSGGKGSATPKGRQLSPEAALRISDLLGDMTRSRDMLIEALHLIQDRYRCLGPDHLVALAEEFQLALTEYLKQRHSIIISMFLKTDGALPGNHNQGMQFHYLRNVWRKELMSELRDNLGDGVRILSAPCMGACGEPRLLPSVKTRS